MAITWDYPIYLIPHGMGFASIVDPDVSENPEHLLVVHTDAEAADEFMNEFGIHGAPRALQNDREFSWLLRSLKEPVTQVTFDPRPREGDVNARWTVPVQELLDDHLTADLSPWNYPVFVIEREVGFACISGRGDGEPLKAVGVFSHLEKAEAYLELSEETGDVHELRDMESTRRFLKSLDASVNAAALDPVIEDGRHSARHCFSLKTLLEKYLVQES